MNIAARSPHTFHIPVMGTGFTIDSPLRVARYGISSAISLVDDELIEQMRRFHCERSGEPYEEISDGAEDARARRITAYLDLLDDLIRGQVLSLQAMPFDGQNDLARYFRLLPESPLACEYREMLAATDPSDRASRQERLRAQVVAGSIDVNIMTKVDCDRMPAGSKRPVNFSDALAALRGFARSRLRSSLIFSAGMNPRLYNYAAEFPDFLPDANGDLKKKIILKVSDYHSAAVQGRYLAKRGLWVSEFRIESGLNCGGHAFPTQGLLLGPILDEFQKKKSELLDALLAAYRKTLGPCADSVESLGFRITVQGGIGTADEDRLLRERYGVDGTGWATPFLLVPEVTNVDPAHLEKLCEATERDVFLSDSSPFGLPFWNLRSSASEEARRRRIDKGTPGNRCSKGFVRLYNTEFTEDPICTASRQYQRSKLVEIETAELTEPQREAIRENVLAKACLCEDLAAGALQKNGLDAAATPAICCGPNIVNFSGVVTLDQMVGHIYDRCSLLADSLRPHMFLREISLYLDYLAKELEKRRLRLTTTTRSYFADFVKNLCGGIEHYRGLAVQLIESQRARFAAGLEALQQELDGLKPVVAALAD